MSDSPRVLVTPQAAALLRELERQHGPLLLHQSGGCCEGSVPLCLRRSEFRVGSRDRLLAVVGDTPFYVDDFHFRFLAEEPVLLDVIPAETDSFSLEAAEGIKFITRPMTSEQQACRPKKS
jgi:uncharacterized protein